MGWPQGNARAGKVGTARDGWRRTSPGPPLADQDGVSKSLIAVGGMGLVSCLLLSLMMQHLLKVQVEKQRPTTVTELEELFRSQLAGPVQTQTVDRDGRRTVVVRMRVLAGLNKQRLATSAGGVVWRRALQESMDAPDGVLFEIGDDGAGRVEEIPVPRPAMLGGPPTATNPGSAGAAPRSPVRAVPPASGNPSAPASARPPG